MPDAVFDCLSDNLPSSNTEFSLDDLPRNVGTVTIFGVGPESGGPQVVASCLGRSALQAVCELLTSTEPELQQVDERIVSSEPVYPPEIENLYTDLAFPPKTPLRQRRETLRQWWQTAVEERWLQLPLQSLAGQTPRGSSRERAFAKISGGRSVSSRCILFAVSLFAQPGQAPRTTPTAAHCPH